MVLGFYARMRKLMRAAGVDVARTLSSMGGQSHAYESWDGPAGQGVEPLRRRRAHAALANLEAPS